MNQCLNEPTEGAQGTKELSKHELTLMYLPPKRNQQRRRKKKLGPNDLITETVPLNDVRRTYPGVIASLTSRASVDEIRAQMKKIVADDSFSFFVATVEKENPFGPVYRENKGLEASIKFLSAYFLAIPDCILAHTNFQFFKRKNGESILKTNFTMTGCMAFKVVVENADQTDDFKCAVEGLQGLQSAMETNPIQASAEENGSEESFSEEDTESFEDGHSESLNGPDDTEYPSKRMRIESLSADAEKDGMDNGIPNQYIMAQQQLLEAERLAKKKKVDVGDTEVLIDEDDDESAYKNMLITSASTNYQLGQRSEGRTFATGGKMIFYMNGDKKLTKIEAQYSAKKTLDSCKYDSLNNLTNGGDKVDYDSAQVITLTAIDDNTAFDDEASDDGSDKK